MSYKAKIFNRNVLKTCPTSKKADPCIRFLTTQKHHCKLIQISKWSQLHFCKYNQDKITTGSFHTNNQREISIKKWLSTMQRSRQVIIALSSQLPKLIQTHLLSQTSSSTVFKTIIIMNYSSKIKTIIFLFFEGNKIYS